MTKSELLAELQDGKSTSKKQELVEALIQKKINSQEFILDGDDVLKISIFQFRLDKINQRENAVRRNKIPISSRFNFVKFTTKPAVWFRKDPFSKLSIWTCVNILSFLSVDEKTYEASESLALSACFLQQLAPRPVAIQSRNNKSTRGCPASCNNISAGKCVNRMCGLCCRNTGTRPCQRHKTR
jgi:hypothetical protein